MNNEDTYNNLARITSMHREHFSNIIIRSRITPSQKKSAWLRVMGLMETWHFML